MPLDLHSIVFPITQVVNGASTIIVRASTGYDDTLDTGELTPLYADPVTLSADIQPASSGDLRQLEALNVQGVKNVVYVQGSFDGVVRPLLKGGDIIEVPSGLYAGVYLVAVNIETWPTWCKLGITLQNEDVT